MYVILISVVGIAAITVNYIISTKEQLTEATRERLTWLQQQSETIFTCLKLLRQIDCNSEIIEKINLHAMAMFEEIAVLAPDSELLASITQLKEIADRALPGEYELTSDRSVKRVQIYINYAEKLVLQMGYMRKINPALAKSYRRELYLLKIAVVADAHIQQGNKLLAELDDKNTALSHFKHAKAILLKANIPPKEKAAKLEQVNREIQKIQPQRTRSVGTLADSIDKLL